MITKQPTTHIDYTLNHNEISDTGAHCRAHARFFCLRCYSPLETVRT
jgi:hypothetical protein